MCKSVRICQRSSWGYEDNLKGELTYQHWLWDYPQFYQQNLCGVSTQIFSETQIRNLIIINLSTITTTSTTIYLMIKIQL